jgi:prophage antirepressor-like protein
MRDLIPSDFNGENISYFLEDDGTPWWPARAPCVLLGYDASNASHILDRLDSDEKELKVTTRKSNGATKREWCVNEAGMYSLILWSEKPEAKQFKRWLTHEVLPTIRRQGRYSISDRDIINGFLSPVFQPWEKRFELEFFQEVCRVYGQPIPKDDKHSPMMASFMSTYIYKILPVPVRKEMDHLNPIFDKKEGTRKLRLHQLLKEERVKDFLTKRIEQLMTILRLCRGPEAKKRFKIMIAEHDTRVGITIPIEQNQHFILSMILPEQMTLFDENTDTNEALGA